VAIGFLLIRISTTTQQPDTVLAIDRLDKEGRIVFDRFFGRDDDQDAASNADAASDESAESDAGPMAETSPGPQSLLGETYDITEQNTDYVGASPSSPRRKMRALSPAHTSARCSNRASIQHHRRCGSATTRTPNEGSVKHRSSLSRSSGTSGSPAPPATGKTTELLNMMVQWAYSGYGFVYFDPKGP